ncbi:MAG TPA: GNAT family N-acetyltransferase [Kofleriaceae bacterium]|jgi:ribosomal protein S18 acetylase RimI-like enzyme|nr:GNAT family N-acetyltransferase [Kofleriaceae bacterium]
MSRFGIREAEVGDAEAIARAHTASWQTSYRGILPDTVLDRIDVGQRAASRRKIISDRSIFQLVAYDLTHGDIVGFCDAGPSRRDLPSFPQHSTGEVYAIYLVQHAKRHGLGQEMFDRVMAHFTRSSIHQMVVWVLDNNDHARRFYEALGGHASSRVQTRVGGFPVTELAYVWSHF